VTLIFALLREDHIVFASDRRHILKDGDGGRYINDDCWKTEKILSNSAMLGFAGHDFVEEIIQPLKRRGDLENGSIRTVANKIASAVQAKNRELSQASPPIPTLEFLIAGFEKENGGNLATVLTISPPTPCPNPHWFDPDPKHDNFAMIGKHRHGALYVFRKCVREMMSIEAGIKLACFTLAEVGKYDTAVGGSPQICIIRPGQEVEDKSDQLKGEMAWVAKTSEQIRRLIVA
jgi:20S proteasome alpha/beta subunit